MHVSGPLEYDTVKPPWRVPAPSRSMSRDRKAALLCCIAGRAGTKTAAGLKPVGSAATEGRLKSSASPGELHPSRAVHKTRDVLQTLSE